jgi:tetratricopeptide (TPR) repeat protein
VQALDVRPRARERRQLARRGTENADAYIEYLKGRYFVDRNDSWAAREHFDRSLNLDPTFAAAWSGLALTYIQLSIQGLVSTSDGVPRGRTAAERALELDPELGEAHAHLASALNWYYWDREGAERHLRQAIALDPSSWWAHWHYAVHLRNLGRFEEALRAVARAKEVDPLNSARAYEEEGLIFYVARQPDSALARFRELLRIDPRYPSVHFFIALVHAQMGRYEQALASLRQTDPQVRQPDALTIRGYVYARLGQPDEARRALARLDSLASDRAAYSFGKAVVHVGLGDYRGALALLEQAAEERTWHLGLLKVEPVFDPLQREPRFQALLKRLNLAG